MDQTSQTVNGAAEEFSDISWQELYRARDRSLLIVDVLPREAYISGHIPGAISLPLAEVNSRAQEVIPNRDAKIVVYCASAT